MKTTSVMNVPRLEIVLLAGLLAVQVQGQVTRPIDIPAALNNGQVTTTHSTIDIGGIGNLFDTNTESLARSASVNPMTITLNFTTSQTLIGSRIWFLAGDNRWRLETADSLDDLQSTSGSYRVALDWQTGAQATWHTGTFSAPIVCRVVRLNLNRLTGDDFVHLNEWQLFEPEPLLKITDLRRTNSDVRVTWKCEPSLWYEVQASANFSNWSSAGFIKAAADTAQLQTQSSNSHRFFRVRKAQPEDRPSITKRVLVLNMDPILEAHGGVRLHEHLQWNNPRSITTNYLADLTTASGGYVQWEIASWVDLDLWPQKTDGFQYTDETYLQSWANPNAYPFHQPDSVSYETLLDTPLAELGGRSPHQFVVDGDADEIIFWGAPYFGFWESRMVGSTAYWCNAPALNRPSRLYVVMGLNYERGVSEALHSFGHRCESILTHVYGSWSSTAQVNHLWDRFTRVGPKHGVAVSGCGNVHFPPNASSDYDYHSSAVVTSEADRWLDFPNPSGPIVNVSASTWAGPDTHGNFLRWWFARFPKAPGRYMDTENPINNGKLNNWWSYVVDMNEYAESR
jgi:hypothetical protein